MLGKSKNIEDGVKFLFASFWMTFSVCLVGVRCQEGKEKNKNIFFLDAPGKIIDCDVTLNF